MVGVLAALTVGVKVRIFTTFTVAAVRDAGISADVVLWGITTDGLLFLNRHSGTEPTISFFRPETGIDAVAGKDPNLRGTDCRLRRIERLTCLQG